MTTPLAALRRRGAALLAVTTIAAAVLTAGGPAGAAIVPTVPLATAGAYAVLGHSTVTNTGPSVINGTVGLWSGTSITGFPPGIVVPPGTIDATSPAASQAQDNVTIAYNNAAGRSVDATVPANLGGQMLLGGVYDTPLDNLSITGTLTLDGANNPKSVFIFQTDALTTASSSTVRLINGAQQCNVFWKVTSSATLGTNSVFVGNILALASVTVTTGVTVHGRAFARTGAVTLDTDVFTRPTCALSAPTTTVAGGGGGGGTTTTAAGGTASTVPGGGTPTLPGTPPGGPGVPPVAGPPHTGGGPLPSAGFPWFAVLFASLFATAALGGTLRARRIRARSLATRLISSGPSRR